MKLKHFPASNVAPPSSPYHTLILESWDPYLEVSEMFCPRKAIENSQTL